MRILVVIPTTAGALVIRSLKPRPALPASAAFADGDYRPLPWSVDYARLVGPNGPLAGRDPAASEPHELRLSGSFDTGRSWEVPVALAHLLLGRGHVLVADPGDADIVLWSTGALDLDLRPIAGRYELLDKIELSTALIASAPQARLAQLLPPDEDAELARAALERLAGDRFVRLAGADLNEAVAGLGGPSASTSIPPSLESRPRERNRSWSSRVAAFAATAGIAFAAGLMVWLTQYVRLGPSPQQISASENPWSAPAPDQATVAKRDEPPVQAPAPEVASSGSAQFTGPSAPAPVIVEELRAPAGQSCHAVVFGSLEALRNEVSLEASDRFRATRNDVSLCGLLFRPRTAGDFEIQPSPDLRVLAVSPTKAPGGGEIYLFRDGGRQNVVYSVQISRVAGGARKVLASFKHALVP